MKCLRYPKVAAEHGSAVEDACDPSTACPAKVMKAVIITKKSHAFIAYMYSKVIAHIHVQHKKSLSSTVESS